MIEVKELCKSYGTRQAIQDLNFTVDKGSVVGFLGPNGAGKSTTMKIITGFMAPTSGLAKVAGFDVFEDPIEVKRRIGYLPETPPVYSDMIVKDYLTYVAKLKQIQHSKIKSHVEKAIEKTNLGSVQSRLIQNLSKGFRQRVGIAQAIVSDPEVLILDEPTVGLDPKQVAEIRDLINELRGQHTIILSTHILPEVQATCEKVIIIHQGKIVAQDLIENLGKFEAGTAKVQVRLRKNLEQLQAAVYGSSVVSHCERGHTDGTFLISLRPGDDNLSALSEVLVNKGLGLLEFSPVKQDLEDVFLRLTYGAEK